MVFFAGTASNPSTPSPVRKIIVQGGATSGLLTNNGGLLESEGGKGGKGGEGGGEGTTGTTGTTASSQRRPEETPERLKRVVSMKNFEMLKVLGKGSYGKVILVRKTDGEDTGKKCTPHVQVLTAVVCADSPRCRAVPLFLSVPPVRSLGTCYAMKVLKKRHVHQKRQVEHTKTERNVLAR